MLREQLHYFGIAAFGRYGIRSILIVVFQACVSFSLQQHPDRLLIPLPGTLPPGQYRLIVGWYYGPTGERVALTTGGSGDVVEVGTVTVR